MITKAERTELRSIVRGQFKVLRAEVLQRRAELMVNVDNEIADRYAEGDMAWDALIHKIHEITLAANRQVNDALVEAEMRVRGNTERMWYADPPIEKPTRERMQLRMQASQRIEAQVKAALLRLDREEADMLRSLAVGVLESEEARAFLAEIPSVAELVSGARLAELEAQFGDDR